MDKRYIKFSFKFDILMFCDFCKFITITPTIKTKLLLFIHLVEFVLSLKDCILIT